VHRQQEVLDFVEQLQAKDVPMTPRKSLRGLWSGMNIHLTEEDIDENRRDMMRMSPREKDKA